MKPILIAHCAGPYLYPEQTIQSCRDALACGADMVEMDVQFTRDGQPVICHDPEALRLFGVDKLIKDMSFEEFMALRHVKDPSFSSHSLENVLECGIDPLLLHCKIKGEPIARLTKFLHERDTDDRCTLGVLYAEDVATVKRFSSIKTLAFMPHFEQMDSFIASDTDYIRLWEGWVTPELVRRVQDAGKGVWIMAENAAKGGVGYTTEDKIRYWIDLGVSGILINDVRWGRKIF